MPLKKYKHILAFFLLFEAIFVLSAPFIEQNDTFSTDYLFTYKNHQDKKHVNAAFFLKIYNGAFQNYQIRFHSLTKEAATTINSGFSYQKSNYHQYNLTVERLTKLMLFPYHSFW